jgi:prepilin peptidase CpaA
MEVICGKFILCLLISFYNNLTDLLTYKIKNAAVILLSLLGLGINFYFFGVNGLLNSLGGGAIALCLLPLFVLRMLGAGDVKAFIATGFMLGFSLSLEVICYSILAGGVLATLVLLLRRNGMERLRYLFNYLKACCLIGKVLPYTEKLDSDSGGTFRFSYGITLGLLIVIMKYCLAI